jgi:hypothetical protein
MGRSNFRSILVACVLLTACTGGLPPSLRRDISAEADKLPESRKLVESAQSAVDKDLGRDPDLFRDAATPDQWRSRLRTAAEQLRQAERDDRALEDLARQNRAGSRGQADRLLAEERRLRNFAVTESKAVQAEADRWLTFKAALPAELDKLQHEYETVHERSITPVVEVVHKAEGDWPAKKTVLENRLVALEEIPQTAEKLWIASESARKHAAGGSVTGADIAALIDVEDNLAKDEAQLASGADDLRSLSGQLYDSWDKILTDLDAPDSGGERLYRERIKTVRTHLVDPASKKSAVSNSEQWVTVSEPTFHQAEKNLGMAIAHKDVGLFDSEAQTTPQPAGFAYIATEQQGSNQYGYWSHEHGESMWHWLPEYLILRELLWNHDYRPVLSSEYRGYQVARSVGRTFYGQTTPASPPKYGTGGTFTATHYAGSRYAQAGGFKGSAYASDRANRAPSFDGAHAQTRSQPGSFAKSDGSGKRFGSGASAPSGRRFGQSRGFPSAGRSFGRHR